MILNVRELAGDEVLAGAADGRAFRTKVLARAGEEPAKPSLLGLDFEGCKYATGSHLRESIIGLRDALRLADSNWYVVLVRTNQEVREELQHLLGLLRKGDALLTCDLSEQGAFENFRLIGQLDLVQQSTFDLVQEIGDTSAAELKEKVPHPRIELAAWNNRLSALADRGLVVEISQGRLRRYRPIRSLG